VKRRTLLVQRVPHGQALVKRNKTRWASTLNMVRSFLKNRVLLRSMVTDGSLDDADLDRDGVLEIFGGASVAALTAYVDVVSPIEVLTEELGRRDAASSMYAARAVLNLGMEMKPREHGEAPAAAEFRKRLRDKFAGRFNSMLYPIDDNVHALLRAAYFSSEADTLDWLNEQQKAQVAAAICSDIDFVYAAQPAMAHAARALLPTVAVLRAGLSSGSSPPPSPVDWWVDGVAGNALAALKPVAFMYFGMQPTSIESERSFSAALVNDADGRGLSDEMLMMVTVIRQLQKKLEPAEMLLLCMHELQARVWRWQRVAAAADHASSSSAAAAAAAAAYPAGGAAASMRD
jgi:hypothetical protein